MRAAPSGAARAGEERSRQLYATVWITIGTALGGMGRFWISGLVARRFGETFPWGTLVVNVTGSFLIGFVAVFGGSHALLLGGPEARRFLMTGVCGGYTTFSSFSLQTLSQVRDGEWWAAAGNVLLSMLLCLLAAYGGVLAGMALTPLGG
jgi:CrcB protein